MYAIRSYYVAELLNDNLAAGNYNRIFNAASLASGIYFYSLRVDGHVQTRKLNIIK